MIFKIVQIKIFIFFSLINFALYGSSVLYEKDIGTGKVVFEKFKESLEMKIFSSLKDELPSEVFTIEKAQDPQTFRILLEETSFDLTEKFQS